MCTNCGEIYTQAGYKVVAEPMKEASAAVDETKEPADTQTEIPQSSAEVKEPVDTQEPTSLV